jgi:hypothetical protein
MTIVNAAPTNSRPEDQAQDDQSEIPNVTPAEQQMYDAFVTACLQKIYSNSSFPMVVAKLGAGKDEPAQTIGHTSAMIVRSIRLALEGQDKQVPDDVVFAAGQEVVSQLLDIAVGSNIIKQEDAASIGEKAFYEGLKSYGQAMQNAGEITPQMQDIARQSLTDIGHKPPAAPEPQPPAPVGMQQPPMGQQSPFPAAPPAGIVNQAGAQP